MKNWIIATFLTLSFLALCTLIILLFNIVVLLLGIMLIIFAAMMTYSIKEYLDWNDKHTKEEV